MFVKNNPEFSDEVERQGRIIKDVQNAGDIANATQGGTNDANDGPRDQANDYIDSIRNDRVIADPLMCLIKVLQCLMKTEKAAAVDTGFITGALFNMFGMGDEDQGRLSQMRARQWKSWRTSKEQKTSSLRNELKAFASIMPRRGCLRNAEVNI